MERSQKWRFIRIDGEGARTVESYISTAGMIVAQLSSRRTRLFIPRRVV